MDTLTLNLFGQNTTRPGSLGCVAEIAATLSGAMARVAERGISREEIASRMSLYLGEKISVGTLNGYAAPSHTSQAAERGVPERHISLARAMAFDAAVDEDALLGLFCDKRGGRQPVSRPDAALLECAKLQRQEKELAERRKALEAAIRLGAQK